MSGSIAPCGRTAALQIACVRVTTRRNLRLALHPAEEQSNPDNFPRTRHKLRFHELALAEWKKLDNSIRETFKKKLAKRLENPHIPAAALAGMPSCYKIKLLRVGYRLVYRVEDETVYVTVIAVGKRDKQKVYDTAKSRL